MDGMGGLIASGHDGLSYGTKCRPGKTSADINYISVNPILRFSGQVSSPINKTQKQREKKNIKPKLTQRTKEVKQKGENSQNRKQRQNEICGSGHAAPGHVD